MASLEPFFVELLMMVSHLAAILSMGLLAFGQEPAFKKPPSETGILLLAYGGGRKWAGQVEDVKKSLSTAYEAEIALDMTDPRLLQKRVDALAGRKVKNILAVPLILSSHWEILDHSRYLLGLAEKPPKALIEAPRSHFNAASLKRVKTKIPIAMAPAMDDHPLISEIILERAEALSRDPGKECVVLVGIPPIGKWAVKKWDIVMESLAESVMRKVKFKGVFVAGLREDAGREVRKKEEEDFRSLVRTLSGNSKVLVVPLTFSGRRLKRRIRKALERSFYLFSEKGLAPHPNIGRWAAEIASRAGNLVPERKPPAPSTGPAAGRQAGTAPPKTMKRLILER